MIGNDEFEDQKKSSILELRQSTVSERWEPLLINLPHSKTSRDLLKMLSINESGKLLNQSCDQYLESISTLDAKYFLLT
jgi:hypothetical protein